MSGFKRRIGAERALLMLPLNVVMVARVRGRLDATRIADALERLKARHRFLSVRVELDGDGAGWYVDDGVPGFVVTEEDRLGDDQWLSRVEKEYRTPFPIERGPLVRCALVRSRDVSELVLCGHHAVCDGTSLGYLIRDVLELVGSPEKKVEPLQDPPPIDLSTVPDAKRPRPLVRFIMGLMNRKWASRKIRFDEADMVRMHERYWAKHDQVRILAWEMDAERTGRLAARSRQEGVTVNSALWAAFLAAQHECQSQRRRYHGRSGMAVSTRDRLEVPVGEELGFFASSLTVEMPYPPRKSFWDSARRVHGRIQGELEKTDIFRMLISDAIHPTLLDAPYFTKYDGLEEPLPRKLLRRMKWDDVSYGYALTNVGRLDIPTTYGPLELEAVHGPAFFSDVEEKVVGVITVGGKLSIMLTANEAVIGEGMAERIRGRVMEILDEALQSHVSGDLQASAA